MDRQLIVAVVDGILSAGYKITVMCGGDDATIKRSSDRKAVISAMRAGDEDFVLVFRGDAKPADERIGWVRMIYGECGYDVIADNTINLEPQLAGAEALSEKFQKELGLL